MKNILIMILSIIAINSHAFGSVSKNNKAVQALNDTLLFNAEELLKEGLEKDPDNPVLNYNYGLAKLRQFEEYRNETGLSEAIDSFEKAKADTSKSNLQAIYYNQANAYYSLKDFAQAINNYQESASYLDSTDVDLDLVYNYANSLYKFVDENADYDSLLTMVDDMYKAAVSNADSKHKQKIMHNLGNSSFKQEKYQDAINYYIESLKLNPKSEDTRINYEIALKKLAEQQSQSQEEQKENKESDSEKEQENSSNQEEEQQKQEAQEKQEQYDDLSKEEKEKLEAEKKLDALLQEQSRDDDNDNKDKIRQQRPSGRYW